MTWNITEKKLDEWWKSLSFEKKKVIAWEA